MADEVAKMLTYMSKEEFELFPASDREALMSLVHEYFCCDDPEDISSGIAPPKGTAATYYLYS